MRLVLALVAAACMGWAGDARADGATDAQAHAAYERGTTAFRKGDYPTAAREYAAADALAPNAVALQAALDAAVLADDPVLGESLVDRARGAPRTNGLVVSLATAERKFAHRTGRIVLACAAPPCLAAIDGAATPPGVPTVVRVGSHTVTLEAAGTVTTRVVTVAPDETQTIAPAAASAAASAPVPAPASAPAPAPAPASAPAPAPALSLSLAPAHTLAPSTSPSPAWFWLAAGATVVAGGVTVAAAVDTSSRHAAFERTCGANPASTCSSLRSDGISAQTRTNVLLGVTGALAAATLVVAFVVRWHDASIHAGAGALSFDARF